MPGRILLVEDDAHVRRVLRMELETAGATVVEAATGEDAWALLQERGPFDAVVADVRIPPPTGLRILAMLRASGSLVPFVVITGADDDDLPATVAHFRRAAFLPKPFGLQDLVRTVRRVAAESGEGAGSEERGTP